MSTGKTKVKRLLADRVLVQVVKEGESKTKSGIIIPEGVKDEDAPVMGTVIQVSPRVKGCKVAEDKVEVGEVVIFSKYAGSSLVIDRVDYKILRITDIFGVVDPGTEAKKK